MFPEAISSVARRYAPPQFPRDSCALMRSGLQRFRSGISLTGREARTIATVVSSPMLLPLPFQSCLLSFSHIVLLLHALDFSLGHSLWRALGVTHTFLVHLVAELGEQGCTNTLNFHGFSHVWLGDRLIVRYGDEAGEADLRMAKRYAAVTSTQPTASIEDGLKHELYTNFCKAKTKGRSVAFWRPAWSPIVFEQCVVGGMPCGRKFFWLVDTLVQVPDCTLLMHPATQSVRLGDAGAAQDATDVYCICGQCGSMRSGPREWVPFDLLVVSSWPILGLQSLRV